MCTRDRAEGVRIITGTTVKGFQYGSNSSAVTGVETDKGIIKCDHVIVGAGPWAKNFWDMLELPKNIAIKELEVDSIKAMGKVVKYLKDQHGGSVDMSLASKIIKEILQN